MCVCGCVYIYIYIIYVYNIYTYTHTYTGSADGAAAAGGHQRDGRASGDRVPRHYLPPVHRRHHLMGSHWSAHHRVSVAPRYFFLFFSFFNREPLERAPQSLSCTAVFFFFFCFQCGAVGAYHIVSVAPRYYRHTLATH